MEAAYISALAALAGSAIGGLTSFANLMDDPAGASSDAASGQCERKAGGLVRQVSR